MKELAHTYSGPSQSNAAASMMSKSLKSDKPKKSVAFDKETMHKSAPKHAASSVNLTKKRQDMVKKNHVSTGRRGPVASRFEKGSRSQMDRRVPVDGERLERL